MGGGYYDRDVYSSSSSWGYSTTASSAMSTSRLDASMKPSAKPILTSNSKYPVILILDVTGSNIDFARVVYDKLPMFYGEIMAQGYLDDCDLSVCAVGDVNGDSYPLQIGSFNKGTEIDTEIKKLVLESGGGGQRHESYELIADYFLNNYQFDGDVKPIIFFLGDEMPYETVTADDEITYGVGPGSEKNRDYIFSSLNKKFENRVYMMLSKYSGSEPFDSDLGKRILTTWQGLMPAEHVVKVDDRKSIIDLILGIIALNYNKRNMNTYKIDMLKRGQDQLRVNNVSGALDDLSKTFAITPVINQTLDLLKGSTQSTGNIKSSRI